MAERVTDEKVTLYEWGPEDAGKRVGRIEAAPEQIPINGNKDNLLDVVNISITVADVGPEGAKYAYTRRFDGDREMHIFFPGDVSGFVAASSLRHHLLHDEVRLEDSPPVLSTASTAMDTQRLITPNSFDVDSEKVIIEDEETILPAFKETLKKYNLGQLYEGLYYRLNAALGHAGIWSYMRNPSPFGELMRPLVDRDMHDKTVASLKIAQEITELLETQKSEDEAMKQAIMQRAVVDIPQLFVVSRTVVAESEAKIIELEKRLVVPSHVYMPIGVRPMGRTWPYMDASSPTAKEHYGLELDAIRKANSEPALREIDYELKEIKLRSEYATQGFEMLKRLSEAEKEAAEEALLEP